MALSNAFSQWPSEVQPPEVRRPEGNRPEIKRLESIRGVVAQLRDILLDPELACSVEVLNATRPQLEAAVAQFAALDLTATDRNPEVTQQVLLLQGELQRAEALRANASEFWRGWAKLLGVESDTPAVVYSAAGSCGAMAGPSGNVSVRG